MALESFLTCTIFYTDTIFYKACLGLSSEGSLAVVTGLVTEIVTLQVKVILSYAEVKRVCVYRRNCSVLNLHGWPSLAIKKVCGLIAWVGISFIHC